MAPGARISGDRIAVFFLWHWVTIITGVTKKADSFCTNSRVDKLICHHNQLQFSWVVGIRQVV
jgi:hypothetical protein